MTVLKYDAVIKKPRDRDYYLIFFERSYVHHTHSKFHTLGLTDSGFMMVDTFGPLLGLFNVKKVQSG